MMHLKLRAVFNALFFLIIARRPGHEFRCNASHIELTFHTIMSQRSQIIYLLFQDKPHFQLWFLSKVVTCHHRLTFILFWNLNHS
jgi:hypothetical protein